MLKGIRVLDFSQYLPGPYATLRLADLGAEIIKVESPSGDLGRFPSERDGGPRYAFRGQNRDKKSIKLNLKDVAEQKKVLGLIKDADVILESFRPGVTSRLGINYKEVIKVKPDIVYCSLSGYGQNGEMSHLGSHDINYMALSGILSQFKDKDGNPIQPSTTIADLVGGMAASESIIAALLQKEKIGKGTYIDLALADTTASLMTNHVLIESATGKQNGIEKLDGRLVSYNLYETKDGRFISLGAIEEKFWMNFCTALNKEEWLFDHLSAASNSNPIYKEIKDMFKTKTFDEWVLFSQQVDCCMAPVLESGEVANHSYFKTRNLVQEICGLNYVYTHRKEESLLTHSTPPPEHGAHTNILLSEEEE